MWRHLDRGGGIVIIELDEGLCLQGVISGGTQAEGVSSEVLGCLLELR